MKTTDRIWLAISLLAISLLTLHFTNIKDNARNEKYDKCFASLIEENPNEVEARVEYLKECMDR